MATLHQVRSVEALTPKYVSEFQCIGSDCPDSCCSGWAVAIDRKTYNAYQKVTEPSLAPRIKDRLVRTRNTQSDVNYGRIEMAEGNGDCPFMEEKLCSIQKKIGEDKLSDTCFSYPRHTHEMAGVRQQVMTLSCPQAARLALSDRTAMDFTMSKVKVRDVRPQAVVGKPALSPEAMNQVRFFAIQVMRGNGLAVWERLATIGLMCEALGNQIHDDRQGQLATMLEGLATAISAGEVSKALSALLPDHPVQALIFTQLWGDRKSRTRESANQQRIQDDVLVGLGFDLESGDANKQTVVERYKQGLVMLNDLLEAHPALIENYLANELFRELFPFGDSTPMAHFNQLIVRYGVIRLMLVGRSMRFGRTLKLQEAIETIQVFARCYQHNRTFARDALGALTDMKWNTLDKVFRFLRDS